MARFSKYIVIFILLSQFVALITTNFVAKLCHFKNLTIKLCVLYVLNAHNKFPAS